MAEHEKDGTDDDVGGERQTGGQADRGSHHDHDVRENQHQARDAVTGVLAPKNGALEEGAFLITRHMLLSQASMSAGNRVRLLVSISYRPT